MFKKEDYKDGCDNLVWMLCTLHIMIYRLKRIIPNDYDSFKSSNKNIETYVYSLDFDEKEYEKNEKDNFINMLEKIKNKEIEIIEENINEERLKHIYKDLYIKFFILNDAVGNIDVELDDNIKGMNIVEILSEILKKKYKKEHISEVFIINDYNKIDVFLRYLLIIYEEIITLLKKIKNIKCTDYIKKEINKLNIPIEDIKECLEILNYIKINLDIFNIIFLRKIK